VRFGVKVLLFNSINFLFYFFPVVFILYWLAKKKNQRYTILTFASYIFYAFWNWKFTGLMLVSTIVDFFAGRYIAAHPDSKVKRRIGLATSLIANLGLLGFFKYFNFTVGTFSTLASLFGIEASFPVLKVILPVGISFYTFQTMSYSIDIYLKRLKPTNKFMEFACYVSLFPQLVAGPIVRYSEIMKDLDNVDSAPKFSMFHRGINRFVLGIAKKVIIADTIAMFINPLFANFASLGFITAWLAILGYTYQLYFDFSGYSDMAIGLGLLFGFNFPENFNSPYKAKHISDFWRRWHMSLSRWLKDYVYISWLGGNRKGKVILFFNLILTMFLGGLWHGASWTFVVWGLYHGILIAIHKVIAIPWRKMPIIFQRGITFFLVVIGWVFFRSESFEMAAILLKKMFTITATSAINFNIVIIAAFVFGCFIITNFFKNTGEMKFSKNIWWAMLLGGMLVFAIILIGRAASPFLYYQF